MEENTYCKRTTPFSWTTKYYRLEVEMEISTSRFSYTNRGFVLGYVSYKPKTGKIFSCPLKRDDQQYVLSVNKVTRNKGTLCCLFVMVFADFV